MTLPGNGNVQHEACKPVLRQSVPFCFKALDLFFLFSFFCKWTYITHPFLPHPPFTRHAVGMKGVAQVEQDGFTSANEGSNTAQGEVAFFFLFFCLDAKETTRMSCFLTDILSLPCDSHWQGSLCHTLGCNGTNAARDTVYCAFLPAHWTLAAQLCKTCSIDVTDTTVSFAL